MTRFKFQLFETECGSDDPRAIQGGGGASETYYKTITCTVARKNLYLRAHNDRYGDTLVARRVG